MDVQYISKYIFLESNLQKADMALVFGTHHREAINKVYELYYNGFISKILVSGGINKVTGENEAIEMSKKLIEFGVKKDDIIIENQSTNTLENVLFSKKIIEEKFGFDSIKKIIVVVKHYHSRRALMTLKKYFPKNIELIPITYEIHGFTKENWFKSENSKNKVMSELNKIQKYLKKGDIEEIGK